MKRRNSTFYSHDPLSPIFETPPASLISANALPVSKDNIISEKWISASLKDLFSQARKSSFEIGASESEYPVHIRWNGILVDDEGHSDDIIDALRRVLAFIEIGDEDSIEEEVCKILSIYNIREYFRNPGLFFSSHLDRYSKSNRSAPIYSGLRVHGVQLSSKAPFRKR